VTIISAKFFLYVYNHPYWYNQIDQDMVGGAVVAFLIFATVSRSFVEAISTKVLLLGDSVDRYITEDYCQSEGLNATAWGERYLKYSRNRKSVVKFAPRNQPAIYCKDRHNNTLASVHIFGVAATGPYHSGFKSDDNDPYVDTLPRIKKSIEIFISQFGYPTRIILHTAMWDSKYVYQRDANYYWTGKGRHNYSSDFAVNLKQRIDDIFATVGNISRIGLRTAVWDEGPTIRNFNRIIREVAIEKNTFLFDYDAEVWSTVGFNAQLIGYLLRDAVHPHPNHTAAAGYKIMNYCDYCLNKHILV
jgi:hypothetical protein